MKQRRPMRQQSEKGAEREKAFEAARRRVLARDRHQCQAVRFLHEALDAEADLSAFDGLAFGECDRHVEVHHIRGRRDRALYADDDNLVTLCAAHHEYAHANRQDAVMIGLIGSVNQVRDD